jgi:hypothetical protein
MTSFLRPAVSASLRFGSESEARVSIYPGQSSSRERDSESNQMGKMDPAPEDALSVLSTLPL